MAGEQINDFDDLAAAPADDDQFIVIDKSDTTDDPDGTNKLCDVVDLRAAVIQIQTFIADPSGVTTDEDVEARTAINAILDLLIAIEAMEAS